MLAVGNALRFGRIDANLLRLPGAPNLTAIKNTHAFSRYDRAIRLAHEAEQMRVESLRDIVTDLREDWTDAQIFKAFE